MFSSRPVRPRAFRLAVAAAAIVALTGGLAAASASAGASTASVRRACAAPQRTGVMSCLALIRTDVPQRRAAAPGPTAQAGPTAPVGDGYGPADLQSAYDLTSASASNGTATRVAVVDAYNDPRAKADFTRYRSAWGLPACTTATGAGCLTVVNQQGATSPLPANAGGSGWDLEESLDVDMVAAICPNCHVYLVEATSPTITNLGTGVDAAVSTLHASFVSNSYGGNEGSNDATWDTDYFRHPGVAITASSGDDGYGVEYPASSQYVTSVGGTSLLQAGAGRGWTETVWNGTGSGCAKRYEARPPWQTFSLTTCDHRLDNDVAAVADPNTGVAVYNTYSEGGWVEVGGTSASSPIIASVYALAGAPAPGSYPASYPYAHPGALYDVTSGADGTCTRSRWCTAGTGYDGPTGWGTPNGLTAFTG